MNTRKNVLLPDDLQPAKTAAQRRSEADQRLKAQGYTGRKKWLTPAEHVLVDAFIVKIREAK